MPTWKHPSLVRSEAAHEQVSSFDKSEADSENMESIGEHCQPLSWQINQRGLHPEYFCWRLLFSKDHSTAESSNWTQSAGSCQGAVGSKLSWVHHSLGKVAHWFEVIAAGRMLIHLGNSWIIFALTHREAGHGWEDCSDFNAAVGSPFELPFKAGQDQ